MRYLNEKEERDIKTESELNNYLLFRKANDRWLQTARRSCALISVKDLLEKGMQGKKGGVTKEYALKMCGMEEEEFDRFLDDNNYFLECSVKMDTRTRKVWLPVRECALRSICQRAGLLGPTIANGIYRNAVPNAELLDRAEIAEWITKAMKLYSDKDLIFLSDEEVSGLFTDRYGIVPEDLIVTSVKKFLDDNFPNNEFTEGKVSHTFFTASYMINDEEMEEDIQVRLASDGSEPEEVHAIMKISTSNTADCAVAVTSILQIGDKKMLFGRPSKIRHVGQRTGKDVTESVKKQFSMYQKSVAALEKLMNTVIRYPAGCLRTIGKEYGLPKKYIMEAALPFEERQGVTAYEIYWALNQMISEYEKDHSQIQVANLQEAIAEIMTADFVKYDAPFTWARGGETENEAAA